MLHAFLFLGFELLLCGFLVIAFTYAQEMEYKALCKFDNIAIGFVISGVVTLIACALYVYITISA